VGIGTTDAYKAIFLVNALTFTGAWVFNQPLPRYEPLPKPPGGACWVALTDKAYVGPGSAHLLVICATRRSATSGVTGLSPSAAGSGQTSN
jgi:hypothetical protein